MLDELNRRKAVVYVHPTDAACCSGLIPRVPNQMLEYPMDTMRTIASLVVSETATRCPDVRFIFSHAGGPLVGVAGRAGDAGDGQRRPLPELVMVDLGDRGAEAVAKGVARRAHEVPLPLER